MSERILRAAQHWATEREVGTHASAEIARGHLVRTITDEIAAAVAVERARVITASRRLAGELPPHDRAAVGYVISCLDQVDATPAPTPATRVCDHPHRLDSVRLDDGVSLHCARCGESVPTASPADEALANYPAFVCPAHGGKRWSDVRWIEGAHRCDECGEACSAATFTGAAPTVRYATRADEAVNYVRVGNHPPQPMGTLRTTAKPGDPLVIVSVSEKSTPADEAGAVAVRAAVEKERRKFGQAVSMMRLRARQLGASEEVLSVIGRYREGIAVHEHLITPSADVVAVDAAWHHADAALVAHVAACAAADAEGADNAEIAGAAIDTRDAVLAAIRAYGDQRARAASAVPAVVRRVVEQARNTARWAAENSRYAPMRRAAREEADALDAWLRATTGAQAVARATQTVVAAARRFVQARYGVAASPLAPDPGATYDRAAKMEGDAWDALHRAVWELDDLEAEGEEVGSTNPVSTTNSEDPMSQQQTAAGAGRPVTDEQLHHWFTYHAPSGSQLEAYQAVRDAGKAFATVIRDHCPPGPDTTTAIRKVREAVMTANAAIACDGR